MKHVETCRCTASITVEDDQRADVVAAVQTWRASHICLPPGTPTGFTVASGRSDQVTMRDPRA